MRVHSGERPYKCVYCNKVGSSRVPVPHITMCCPSPFSIQETDAFSLSWYPDKLSAYVLGTAGRCSGRKGLKRLEVRGLDQV